MKSYELKPTYENLLETYCNTMIGNMEFTAQTKGVLMRISSLLLEYANFNVD